MSKEEHLTSRGIKKAEAVDPVKDPIDINRIKNYLLGKEKKRDYCLFVVGINIGLRAGDLLQLKIEDVLGKDEYTIYEEKTKKKRVFGLNQSVKDAINVYLDSLKSYNMHDYLFSSQKGGAITVISAHKIIKNTLKELNIKGNYGTHSLRKTFCYQVYVKNIAENPTILTVIQEMLGHTQQSTTLRYMGINKDVISNVYKNLNL